MKTPSSFSLVRAELQMNEKLNVEAVLREKVRAPYGDYWYSREFEDIEEAIQGFGLKTVEALDNGEKVKVCLLWNA